MAGPDEAPGASTPRQFGQRQMSQSPAHRNVSTCSRLAVDMSRLPSRLQSTPMDQTITHPVPDPMPDGLGPDAIRQPDEVHVEAQRHVDERAVEAQPAEPPGVEGGDADQVSEPGAMQTGDLVGDDDRAARPGHPAHLA